MTNFAEDPFLNPLRSCRKGEEEWGAINSGSFDPQGVGGAEETLSNFALFVVRFPGLGRAKFARRVLRVFVMFTPRFSQPGLAMNNWKVCHFRTLILFHIPTFPTLVTFQVQ